MLLKNSKTLLCYKTCTQTGSVCPENNLVIAVAYGWKIMILLLDVNYSTTAAAIAIAAASVKSNHEHVCYYPDSSAEHRTSQKVS